MCYSIVIDSVNNFKTQNIKHSETEMGCVWMMRHLLHSNLSMASLSSSFHQSPLSFPSSKPPLSLISLVFSLPRCSLSTAASNSPTPPHVSVYHNSTQYGESSYTSSVFVLRRWNSIERRFHKLIYDFGIVISMCFSFNVGAFFFG